MGGHIVIALKIMSVSRVAIRCPALEQGFKVVPHGRVGIFSDPYATTGVAYENMGNSAVHRSIANNCSNFASNLGAASAPRTENKMNLLSQVSLLRLLK